MKNKAQLADLLFRQLNLSQYVDMSLGTAYLQEKDIHDLKANQWVRREALAGNIPNDPLIQIMKKDSFSIKGSSLRRIGITWEEIESHEFGEKDKYNDDGIINPAAIILARRELKKNGASRLGAK